MPRRAARPRVAEARTRYHIRQIAEKRGWDTRHVAVGGDFLEENEIVAAFPNIGLGLDKPDFLVCIGGEPRVVIEAKNESGKSQEAIDQAIGYADQINATNRYQVNLAVGASGTEEHGFIVVVRFRDASGEWKPLTSQGYELTTLPSRRETELAYAASDATTEITLPSQPEFIDAAIEVSRILRTARVEAPLRPKVIGALVLVMYEEAAAASNTDDGLGTSATLAKVNSLVSDAIAEADELSDERKSDLVEALHLSSAAFEQLEPRLGRIIAILRRLNVRAVMHSGVDFLGTFYEAFLRYGYDNNALGIVFTPRHITRLCVELVGADYTDKVIDIACGTGGFLVSAFDSMMRSAPSDDARQAVRRSIFGFDTNPTVWALALLNMYFRGDGKSNIDRASSLARASREAVEGQFTRSFLNPPFSQEDEPERQFIDAATAALKPGGLLAVVVKSGVFADQEHAAWRAEYLRKNSVLAVISLPDDLFYPTAAPTSILVAKAKVPQNQSDLVYLARISNDGFEKLKGRRVERSGSELAAITEGYATVRSGVEVHDSRSTTVKASTIWGGNEWSPHEWLPQPELPESLIEQGMHRVAGSLLQTLTVFPDLIDAVAETDAGGEDEQALPPLPYGAGTKTLSDLFVIDNGKSQGEKNYIEGDVAYVSSGDPANSITGLVSAVEGEVFDAGQITVTAFGQAAVQPWPFMARGNGGSSVRVLKPRYAMTARELIWFATQINLQRWRFFYARMAIKSRIVRLEVQVPTAPLPDDGFKIVDSTKDFLDTFQEQQKLLVGR